MEEQSVDISEVLEVAAEAGHILLENGEEIARIEEIMERMSAYYGVTSRNFFVLSNGIFTTGNASESGPVKHRSQYANVEFIPLKGTRMDMIVAVKSLLHDIEAGQCSLEQARQRIRDIRAMKAKPIWEQLLGSAFGSLGFCAIFGGGLLDCLASFVIGAILWLFLLTVTSKYFSKLLGNIVNGAFTALLCYLFWKVGFGRNLDNMIVGSLIPLIPGVPFTNGIRDLANEDYLAGTTRLLDALLVFLAITIGSTLLFLLFGSIEGQVHILHGAGTDPVTSLLPLQLLAAFVGTVGFSVLFSSPRKQYVACGLVGMICWGLYIVLYRYCSFSVPYATLVSALLTAIIARLTSFLRRCPKTVFLICGLFPLIPGGGIFWTTYYLFTSQNTMGRSSGISALLVTCAIVLGVVVVSGLEQVLRRKKA